MPKLWVWLLLVVVLARPAGADTEPQDSTDVTKWREDLAMLREQMPKTHGNLFHTMTRQQFDGALDALEVSLPELTASQVKAGIMRLVAMVNDGHTRVRQETFGNHIILVRLHFFADGLYVVSADKAYADIVGGKVKKIGMMSAEDAYAAVRPLISVDADNEGRRRLLAVDFLVTPEVLQAIGATKSVEAVDLTVEKEGRETTARVSAAAPGAWKRSRLGRWSRRAGSVRASTPGTRCHFGRSILTSIIGIPSWVTAERSMCSTTKFRMSRASRSPYTFRIFSGKPMSVKSTV